MSSPLVKSMIDSNHIPVLDSATIDQFLAAHHDVVMFLVGDTNSFPEGNDVAVILPELMQAFAGRLSAAVVAPAIERDVQLRYRVKAWPALVFVRRGEYLGTISRVQDWDFYLKEISAILNKEPSQPPPLDFKNVCGQLNSA